MKYTTKSLIYSMVAGIAIGFGIGSNLPNRNEIQVVYTKNPSDGIAYAELFDKKYNKKYEMGWKDQNLYVGDFEHNLQGAIDLAPGIIRPSQRQSIEDKVNELKKKVRN